MIGVIAFQNRTLATKIEKIELLAPAVYISHQASPIFDIRA